MRPLPAPPTGKGRGGQRWQQAPGWLLCGKHQRPGWRGPVCAGSPDAAQHEMGHRTPRPTHPILLCFHCHRIHRSKAYHSIACSIITMLCNQHLCLLPKHFRHPEGNPAVSKQSLTPYAPVFPFPCPWHPLICSLALQACLWGPFPIHGIIHCVVFCVCLHSLGITAPRFIHAGAGGRTQLFFRAE